jgi:bacterioferritin-associated ferredoxin
LQSHPQDGNLTLVAAHHCEGLMIVCLCRAISDRAIQRAIDAGATTVKQVGQACGAGTGCGACKVQISQMLQGTTPIAGPATVCAKGNCAPAAQAVASSAA